ncbi:MAG: hypothetical protein HRU15_17970 [Planctomycetes bacterium]|nr:hypothetical protein [Planctomycetota bacterium]
MKKYLESLVLRLRSVRIYFNGRAIHQKAYKENGQWSRHMAESMMSSEGAPPSRNVLAMVKGQGYKVSYADIVQLIDPLLAEEDVVHIKCDFVMNTSPIYTTLKKGDEIDVLALFEKIKH